ncbi:MAG: adenylate/guanylate cyclase domain-containing protein [Thermodesulfobacteriota bacterium]
MSSDAVHEDFTPWKIYLNLYVRNISANLLGFAIILVLNFFTPLTYFRIRKVEFLTEGGWLFLMFIFPFILIIVGLLQYAFQCPVCSCLSALKQRVECTRYGLEQIRKRVLNLPLILALANLLVYILAPLVLIGSFYIFDLFPTMNLRIAALLFFRAVMIGLITSSLSFFIVESYSRRVLIPRVFPEGGLTEVPGVVRVNVGRRIRLLNLAGTLTPMIILVVTLGFVVVDVLRTPGLPDQLVLDIFWFTLVVCLIFILIGFRLNNLVGRSVVKPIQAILQVVDKVKQGDFRQRIQVVSDDEVGVLAEAGNEMIQGLAERERVRDSFGRYLNPEIRDKILSGRIPLDGERREASILFSDLRDFTSYVESSPPEEVILSMREYFTVMEEAVREHEGLILQYVGDELEAVFGVPLEVESHADKALRAALKMRHGLKGLNRKRQAESKPPFRHGIGICSGPVLAGNTGSRDHPAYALIGDTVNKASRIQELTKDFGVDILIAEETRRMLGSAIPLRRHEAQSVKGHASVLVVHEVLPA